MRKSFLLSLLLLGTFIIFPAWTVLAAEKLVNGQDPDAILNIAKGYGSASMAKDNQGDPQLTGKIDGTSYNIHFYGCTNGTQCDSIQFAAGWSKDVKEVSLEDANAWNRRKRFVNAFTNKDGLIFLKMDVMLRHGVAAKNLEVYFDIWQSVVNEFRRDVLQ